MTYTVVWTTTAEADLVRIWTEAADRTAVTRAGNEIDHLLRTSPPLTPANREVRSGAYG